MTKMNQSCDVAEYSKRSLLDGVDWKRTRSLLVSWYISVHCIAISESFICLTTEACKVTAATQVSFFLADNFYSTLCIFILFKKHKKVYTWRRFPSCTSTSVAKEILFASDLSGSTVGSTDSKLGICGA
jgi:hypothetical protein